jgi:hypothetical protein
MAPPGTMPRRSQCDCSLSILFLILQSSTTDTISTTIVNTFTTDQMGLFK